MALVNGKLKRDGECAIAKGKTHKDKWDHLLDEDGDLIDLFGFKACLDDHPLRIDNVGHVMVETCKTIKIER